MKKLKYLGLFILTHIIINNYFGQTHYYLRISGAPVSLTSWVTDPTGAALGTVGVNSPTSFNTSNTVYHFTNRTGIVNLGGIISTFTTGTTPSTVIIEGGFNLNLNNSLARLTTAKLDIANNGTLTISQNVSITHTFNTLDANSTVIYNIASAVKPHSYGNLNIAVTSSLVGNTTAAKLTILGTSVLNLNSNGLTLNGSNGLCAGTGSISGNNLSNIELTGGNGGNNGTLNFTSAGNILDYLFLQLNDGQNYISLGNNLNINFGTIGVFYQLIGSINLNGFNLITDNLSDFSSAMNPNDGVIMGSNNSGIFINGSTGVFNGGISDLYMDPTNNTLKVLSLNSAVATLTAGNTLNIADSLSIQGGGSFETNNNVTLVSSSSLKGRLGNMNNGTLSGDLRVQTFARGGNTDWVNIGVSGVTGETINSGWYGQIPMAIQGSTTGVTSAGGYYFESVQRWWENVSNYDTLVTVSDALIPGEGYWVFLGNALTTTSDMVWTVSGPAVVGPYPVNLTNSGVTSSVSTPGWNLIANPFPSPIDWASVLANNPSAAINNAYYIYDPDLGGTISFAAGLASPLTCSNSPFTNYNAMADIIPMGQAFYVEATGNTTITISEGDKSANNTTNFQLLKTNQAASIGSPIRLNIDGGGYHDDAVIRFHSSATANFDKALDAHKMYSSPGYAGYPGQWSLRTAIATQSNNQDYSINSIPYAQTQNAVMPVVARVYQSGTHTISATELQNLPPGTCVDLKDLYTNTVYDLTSGPCIVTMSDTTYYPRFELTVCANVAASVKNNSVKNAPAIAISKDAVGIYSDFNFTEQTDAKITITNILGQKIVADKKVSVKNERVYIDANLNDNLIFVTVETATERITRKFINIK